MPRISESKPSIVVHDARKTFKLKHTHSFKETFIASLKRKQLSSNFNAVDNVSFSVAEGESVALLGRNGSGKSTTLKLISGVMQPDAGWIRTRGRIAGLLEVGAGFHPDLTGRENVYLNAAILGMSKAETDAQFDSIVEFSEISEFIDTEVKRYSSGMYSRLGFSVAVHTELDVLLVDEVLSVGDAQFREKCNQKMLELQAQGKTMFVVSHNASQVKKLCTRGIVLEKGKIAFDGPIDDAVAFLSSGSSLPAGVPLGGYPVTGAIKAVYSGDRDKYGVAIESEQAIAVNGGGSAQLFHSGYFTTSTLLNETFGLPKGKFLEAYIALGGAAGPWGFLAGDPNGSVRDGNRTLQFQHGQARYTLEAGVEFTRHYSG